MYRPTGQHIQRYGMSDHQATNHCRGSDHQERKCTYEAFESTQSTALSPKIERAMATPEKLQKDVIYSTKWQEQAQEEENDINKHLKLFIFLCDQNTKAMLIRLDNA